MRYKKETVDISKLALPTLLSYFMTTIFEILDQAIVGHYSVEGFALIGVAATIIYSVTGAFGILSVTFGILGADRRGKKDDRAFEQLFTSSKILSLVIGCLFVMASLLMGKHIFRLFYGYHGKQLKDIISYFYPVSITVLQNMLIFLYFSYFRNKLNTKISVSVTIVSTVVNLFFDFSLVYGKCGLPKLGISGAAWGSVIGLFCGLLIYQVAYYRDNHIRISRLGIFNRRNLIKDLKDILALYPSLFGQELIESTVFVLILTSIVTRMGTTQTAIYKVLDIIRSSLELPVFAFAAAAQTYALQQRSAGDDRLSKRYLKAGTCSATVLVVLCCLVTLVFKKSIFSLIISDPTIYTKAKPYLWLVFICVCIKGVYQVYMSYLQGASMDKYVFKVTTVTTIISSILVIILGFVWKLYGIYYVLIGEYLLLGIMYYKKAISNR